MNIEMLNLQRVLTVMKATPKPPKSVQPGGFRWVFDSPKSPLSMPNVKPA